MSTQQLQEIIVDNSIRSFNQGYNAGVADLKHKVIEIIINSTVSASTDDFTVEGITMTPTELIKLIESTK